MAEREAVFPAGRQDLYTINKYSAAIRSGDLLFVSGQVGSREDGSPEPDPEQQVRRAFTNLLDVLAAAGCAFDDVVDCTLFIVDPEATMPHVFKLRDEFWGGEPYSNITVVGVTWLSGFSFEIKAIARIPEGSNG